jgi:F-type H+-transporting ATPase subunit delta
MLGSSGASLARLSGELDAALDGGADGAVLGDGLLGAAEVLRGQVALRRAVTDPTTASESKSGLARTIFSAHLDAGTVALVASAVSTRWGSSVDLPEALGQLGVIAIVKGADRAGEGDRVERELFAFGQAVTENHDLRDALSDPARSVEDKQALVRSLLEGKASSATVRLALESLAGNHRTVTAAIDEYTRVAAAARSRLVATVRSAFPLTAEQSARLAASLGGEQQRPVHLNQVVDPALVGGIHVEIGDHVVDGSIASRLDDARRRIAG